MPGLIVVVGLRLQFELLNGAYFGGGADRETGLETDPMLVPTAPGSGASYIDEPNPCPVDDPPEDVPLADVHAAAAAATIAFMEEDNYRDWEYGAILYELDGRVGFTPPFTQENPDFIDWIPGLPAIPSGARILGLLHNHPDQDGVDDRTPTRADWGAYDRFQNLSLSRRVTIDPNIMYYVATTPYSRLKTYVYNKNNKYTRNPGCTL